MEQYIYVSAIIIIFIFSIFRYRKIRDKIDKEVLENLKTLLSFGIPLIMILYPIVNYYHTTLSALILIICFIYMIDNIMLKNFFSESKKAKIIYILIISLILLYSAYTIVCTIAEVNNPNYCFEDENPYYGSFYSKEVIEDIAVICNYIQEQEQNNIDVKILSYKANLYMVQLNKNNGMFDLPFLGNLGKGGEAALINEIKKLDNTILLIETDFENIFGQESEKVRDYIINNYEKKGEIQEYSIYYIK